MGEILSFPQSRRRHPRVRLVQPVALVHENATVATSVCANISSGGMQVVCDRYTTDSLHPNTRRITRENAPYIDAHLKLPANRGLTKLDCECRMTYLIADDDSRFTLGLEFLSLHEPSRNNLSAFLTEALELDES